MTSSTLTQVCIRKFFMMTLVIEILSHRPTTGTSITHWPKVREALRQALCRQCYSVFRAASIAKALLVGSK